MSHHCCLDIFNYLQWFRIMVAMPASRQWACNIFVLRLYTTLFSKVTGTSNRVVGNSVKFYILIYLGPLHKYPIKKDFSQAGVWNQTWNFVGKTIGLFWDFFIATGSLQFCRHGLIFKLRPLPVGKPSNFVHLCNKLENIIFWNSESRTNLLPSFSVFTCRDWKNILRDNFPWIAEVNW